jgi:hypothetical protein
MRIENPKKFLEAVHSMGDFGLEPNRSYDETLLERRDGAGIHIRNGRPLNKWDTIEVVGRHDNILISLEYEYDWGKTQGYLDCIRIDVLDTEKASDDYLNYFRKVYKLRDSGWLLASKSVLNPKYYRNLKDSGYYLHEEDVRRSIDMHATAALFFAKASVWMADHSSFEHADLTPELVLRSP